MQPSNSDTVNESFTVCINSRNITKYIFNWILQHWSWPIIALYDLCFAHYNDVIMGAMASQITSLAIVYSIVYSGADQRKHQSPASLAFVLRIHRLPVNSRHKWPVTRIIFPFDDVIMTKVFVTWLDLLCCHLCPLFSTQITFHHIYIFLSITDWNIARPHISSPQWYSLYPCSWYSIDGGQPKLNVLASEDHICIA